MPTLDEIDAIADEAPKVILEWLKAAHLGAREIFFERHAVRLRNPTAVAPDLEILQQAQKYYTQHKQMADEEADRMERDAEEDLN